jgi:UDP-2,4-diacetamido-2,4,6-trideoxy-beta-L-altropyranose hydrolase
VRLLIRADGDQHIGTGHVMRCLALAEGALAAGGVATLASVRLDAGLAARVTRAGLTVRPGSAQASSRQEAAWLIAEARRAAADWVVVDGYAFTAAYLSALRDAGLRVLLVDDFAALDHYPVALLVNHHVFAEPGLYPAAGVPPLLLGPGYALLRGEFVRAGSGPAPLPPRGRRVLVTLGGADPNDVTSRVVAGLRLLPEDDLQVTVVAGPANPHRASLERLAADPRIRLLPPQEAMAPLMAAADVAVIGAGGTAYELACLGTPIVVAAIAPSQERLALALERAGMAVNLGPYEALTPGTVAMVAGGLLANQAWRGRLRDRGRALVDGRGAARVLAALGTA